MRLTITALCLALLSTRAVANIIPVVNVIISYPHETSTVIVNQCIAFIRLRGGIVPRIYSKFAPSPCISWLAGWLVSCTTYVTNWSCADDIRSFAATAELPLINEVSAAETNHLIMIRPGGPAEEWHRG
jgi:hypothetical protein